MRPVGSDAGIVFLDFSVIVITASNNLVELLSLSRLNLSPGAEPVLRANSSKFDFTQGFPLRGFGYQWVTGENGSFNNVSSSTTKINYWTRVSLIVEGSNSSLRS